VVASATTAEHSSLTVDERNRLVTTAIEASAGRVPIGRGDRFAEETLQLTQHADRAGVSAVMVVTPYYIRPPRRGLVDYFEQVGKVTSKPILIYHIPGRAASEFRSTESEKIIRSSRSTPYNDQ
jgi:4-hydroxy-tetrahydrodipicolinate synthase